MHTCCAASSKRPFLHHLYGEADLLAHFARTLDCEVDLDTDFFEAGGDSLGVLRLISRLSQEFSLELSSGELFLHSTPRRMAARLERLIAGAARPRHLFRLTGGRGRPSVFLVHPIGGHLAAYGRLAVLLDAALTLFGLQAIRIETPYESIEERCAAYAQKVVAASNGPLIVGGYSLGGVLALEMAEQLRRAGRDVSMVLLIDRRPAPVQARLGQGHSSGRPSSASALAYRLRSKLWMSTTAANSSTKP